MLALLDAKLLVATSNLKQDNSLIITSKKTDRPTALVVVELKTGKFKSSYLGQLMEYLTILDDKVRKPHENPSIGIVLCKEANKSYVEYIIKAYDKPIGVATYKTSQDMPDELRRALPDMEELKKLL